MNSHSAHQQVHAQDMQLSLMLKLKNLIQRQHLMNTALQTKNFMIVKIKIHLLKNTFLKILQVQIQTQTQVQLMMIAEAQVQF